MTGSSTSWQPPGLRPFTTNDPGTSEAAWLADPRWDEVPRVDPIALAADRVLVLAAHPDDETLGVGALVADLTAADVAVDIVVATDGAASHPGSTLWSPGRLAARRRAELDHAARLLGADAHHLDLSDGDLGRDPAGLLQRLRLALPPRAEGSEVVLAPYLYDGHGDHDILGAAAERLARERDAELWFYPIWAWQWSTPDELPWHRLVSVQPSARALRRKGAAIAAHRSQVEPLSPLPGDEAMLTPEVLTRFRRVIETLVAGPDTDLPDTREAEMERRRRRREGFDRMLDDGPDPWASTSDYERRKHELTVALLTRRHYGEVVEVGCATGALSARLAERADHVTGVDGSARALEVARGRGLANVAWVHGEIPHVLVDRADDSADLVVISEVAYFLTGPELLALLRQVRRLLRDEGEVVVVDWRAGSSDLPLDGELVHDQLTTALADLGHRLTYRDDSALIDVWGGRPIVPADRDVP